MTRVYQTIVDPNHGNCMQAVIASLLELSLDDVPHFLEFKDRWFTEFVKFLNKKGYRYHGMFHNKNYNRLLNPTSCCFKEERFHRPNILSITNLKKAKGINGYFYGSVLSPKNFNFGDGSNKTHAIIIDVNCRVVHDVNQEYKNIIKYPLSDLLKYNGVIDVYDLRKKDKR